MGFSERFDRLRASAARLGAVALAAGLIPGAAEAATLSCTTPGPGNSGATISLGSASARACFAGNDTNTVGSGFSMFGKTGWVLSDKSNGAGGTQAITFTTAPAANAKSGSWAISGFAGLTHVVVTLKSGSGFAAFLLDSLSGRWTSTKELSHGSIYYNGTPTKPTPSPIPLPAAGLLLLGGLGGLGGLGLVARRRRPAA